MSSHQWPLVRLLSVSLWGLSNAANPIVTGAGLADPHMHVWPGNSKEVFLYATHDCSKSGTGSCSLSRGELGFRMTDWWIWSSADLVNWTLRYVLPPTALLWDGAKNSEQCWATDAASFPNGTTLFYLSVGPRQIGVVKSDAPNGPFRDPLGKPLIPEGMVPTYSRDPGVLMDDDGACYLIWGTFTYFIAKLNPDMTSLAEEPRGVKIWNQQHRDDKPFLHKIGAVYYLSWGCFYAMGTSVYGPFNYTGSVIDDHMLDNTTFASGGGLQDRHGSFFTFHGQTYFACNDRSHGGGSAFRNSIVAYVHYRRNGTIAPIRIDETGVGEYDVMLSRTVQAEDFFSIAQAWKQQRVDTSDDHFEVVGLKAGSRLSFPKLRGEGDSAIVLRASNGGVQVGVVEVSANGSSVGTCEIKPTGSWVTYVSIPCGRLVTGSHPYQVDVVLDFRDGNNTEFAHLDFFSIGTDSTGLRARANQAKEKKMPRKKRKYPRKKINLAKE